MRGGSEATMQTLIMVIFAAAVALVIFMVWQTQKDSAPVSQEPKIGSFQIFPLLIFSFLFQFIYMKGQTALTAKNAAAVLIVILLGFLLLAFLSNSSVVFENLLGPIVNFFNGVPQK